MQLLNGNGRTSKKNKTKQTTLLAIIMVLREEENAENCKRKMREVEVKNLFLIGCIRCKNCLRMKNVFCYVQENCLECRNETIFSFQI